MKFKINFRLDIELPTEGLKILSETLLKTFTKCN
jgi:hypothetical protein